MHGVLERLFELPAAERCPRPRTRSSRPCGTELCAREPELAGQLFTGPEDPELPPWLESAVPLLETYFRLEDPARSSREARELLVETELESGLLLRGYVDRIDVAPTGEVRVIDYKTGAAPRPVAEARALFQMKFYALTLLHLRGVVPAQLRLMYLSDTESLTYEPDEAELRRFERTLEAIWQAILAAGRSGDFRPNPGRLCDWCGHKALCPAWDGTPPAYPGWPGNAAVAAAEETPVDRAAVSREGMIGPCRTSSSRTTSPSTVPTGGGSTPPSPPPGRGSPTPSTSARPPHCWCGRWSGATPAPARSSPASPSRCSVPSRRVRCR